MGTGVLEIVCGIFRTLCKPENYYDSYDSALVSQKIILKAAVVYFRFVVVFFCTGAGFSRYSTAAS